MTAVLILDQKVSDGPVKGRKPIARCEDLNIIKLLRLEIFCGKHFFPANDDEIHHLIVLDFLANLNVDPFAYYRECLDPLGVAVPPIDS